MALCLALLLPLMMVLSEVRGASTDSTVIFS